jgi:hypothetical protein
VIKSCFLIGVIDLMTDRQIMYDKSNFLREGIMNNHDRRNLNIRSIIELKIHMQDRITTSQRER